MAEVVSTQPKNSTLVPRNTAIWLLVGTLLCAAVAFAGPKSIYYLGGGLAGAGVLLLVLLRPSWCVYLLLAMTMLLREYPATGWRLEGSPTLYGLSIGMGASIYLLDIVLLAALAGVLLRAWWKREPLRIAPESIPLLLFVAAGPVFFLLGLANGHGFHIAAADYRILYRGLLLYLLAITVLDSPWAVRTAVKIILAVAGARVLWGTGKYLLGYGELYWLFGAGHLPVPFLEQADAQICALVAIAAFAFWAGHAQKLRTAAGAIALLLFLSGSFGAITSLRRSAWLTLAVGLIVVMAFRWRQRRLWGLVLVLLVAGGVYYGVAGGGGGKYVGLGRVAIRFASLFEEQSGGTSEARHYGEIADAWANIKQRPLQGWGLGHVLRREYSREVEEQIEAVGRLVRIHDVYLDIWVKMGLAGLVLFLWWIGATTRRFYRSVQGLKEGESGWIALGLGATWVGWLFASLGTTMIFAGNRIAFMFFGIAAVLTCLDQYENSVKEGLSKARGDDEAVAQQVVQ